MTKRSSVYKRRRFSTLLVLIIAGETIFFLPFVLARIFRPSLLELFEISNTELGSYFSIYGMVAMISYLFGGNLADRFPARSLMSIALWLTGAGGVVMAMVPGSFVMRILYAFWGFTTIFLFWAAMIRATREWGGNDYQGRAFGWLEGGRGLTAALLGSAAFLIFFFSGNASSGMKWSGENINSLPVVILVVSLFTVFMGFLVRIYVPSNPYSDQPDMEKPDFSYLLRLAKMPGIWMLSIMIICAYSGYKITDDFSLYAREVLDFSENEAAGVGTSALWIRGIVAVFIGIFADRWKKLSLISLSYLGAMAGGILIGTGVGTTYFILVFLNLLMAMAGIYGVRALYFAVFDEAGIPNRLTGSAVGIVSFLGFTPDVFMSPWMGQLLDTYPGETGHRYVFLLLAGFSLIGLIASLIFQKTKRN